MSKDRIIYDDAQQVTRIIALIIDVVLVAVLAVISQFGFTLEYELFWKSFFGEFDINSPLWYLFWFIIELPLYYWLVSSFTDGQTLGKIFTGIRVVKDDNSSTKREFKLHLKRTFFLRSGTKVVKEKDPEVKGL
ncbi:MAG: hypothetical protein HeimC3_01890 [Candidatus Heimdallarchaeota archaeon LC_3]|nr:MAG: hypothetical protein HeimC3_01890 [Candidatus Heimdallarchaeota archaeon LC_3]